MSLFTIGDPHLSLSCDKPMDVFHGWTDYVPRLQKNWNATVSPSDTVVIAGDISWGMHLDEAEADLRFLNELNGQKIILKGNHDLWFETKSKVERFFTEHGFSSLHLLFNNAYEYGDYAICGTRGWIYEEGKAADKKVLAREAGRLRLSLQAGKAFQKPPIAFLHYPPVYYTYVCREIMDVLHEFDVRRCFYGHIHGSGFCYAIDGMFEDIDFRLVSCDYVNFTPVLVL